jgi:hypothetical protein
METSEQLTHGAIGAPDLADLVHGAGPFLSLYLHTDRAVENAGPLSMQRWKTVRRDLEDQDVPAPLSQRSTGSSGTRISRAIASP